VKLFDGSLNDAVSLVEVDAEVLGVSWSEDNGVLLSSRPVDTSDEIVDLDMVKEDETSASWDERSNVDEVSEVTSVDLMPSGVGEELLATEVEDNLVNMVTLTSEMTVATLGGAEKFESMRESVEDDSIPKAVNIENSFDEDGSVFGISGEIASTSVLGIVKDSELVVSAVETEISSQLGD
jgi:hypothetical protein